jgi:hypothetical protein
LITTIKDINKELDDISFAVEKVHTRFSPLKRKLTASFNRSGPRNYHPPLNEEERRRSFSPRKQGYAPDEDQGYD